MADITCEEFDGLIDGYLDGTLAEEKQETFELHYFECNECYTQLRVAERLHSKEVPIVTGAKSASPAWRLLWNWKPAAALAMILAAVISFQVMNNSGHKTALFQVADVPAPVYFQTETRDAPSAPAVLESTAVFGRAMDYYNKKDYPRTLELLKPMKSSAANPKVTFFKGVCYLYTGGYDEAVRAFDVIIEDMNPSYYDEAFYYKAIALLRKGDETQALAQLRHLAEMFSPYAPKARELIQKIKNL
jgi:tetratricopeptide (TPR) repeat protein